MELRIALPALAQRFPDLSLAIPRQELDFRRLSIVYGVDTLPVRLDGVGLGTAGSGSEQRAG
jgi:cytochrome P450